MTFQPCVTSNRRWWQLKLVTKFSSPVTARHKYRIVTTEAEAFSLGLYQVKDRYVVPFANTPQYIQAILHIVEREKVNASFLDRT